MKKRIGVLLSGAGVFDGSEIHEATLTLLYIDKYGGESVCFAPAGNLSVVDHLTKKETGEARNVLRESARIARGEILDISEADKTSLDAVILPGGFGAVKNLCDYALTGRNCTVIPEVKDLIISFINEKKPIGAMCIAPVVVAASLKDQNVHPVLTIGSDMSTADDIEFFGAKHKSAAVDEIVVDEENRIVSTPAYMLGPGIADIAKGIEKLVRFIIEW